MTSKRPSFAWIDPTTPTSLNPSQCSLDTLINALPGIVFACSNDSEWSMTYLSDGCLALTGYRSQDLVGQQRQLTFNEVMHPDDLPRVLRAIDRAIAQHRPYELEYRIRTKSGQEKWVWEKGHGLYNAQHQPYRLEGFITDITPLKQAEQAIQEQEAFLRLLLDNIPLSIFWKDWNSVFLGCNRNFATLVGLSEVEQVIGKTDEELSMGEVVDRYRHEDQQIIESGESQQSVRQQAFQTDSTQVWTKVYKVPLRNAAGQVVGVLGTLEDITDQRHAEAAIQAAEAKYRSIFENAVEGIFQTTLEGRYLAANPMLAKIYGDASVEDLVARITNIETQLYVDQSRRHAFRQRLQQHESIIGFESQVYRRDGSIIWISESARTIRDEYGNLLGYEGTVEDITQRKQAEAELYKRDRLLQGVADAMNHLLTEVDYDLAISQALQDLGQAAEVDRVYIYQNHPHPETGETAMTMRYEWVRETIAPSINQPHWQNQSYQEFELHLWYEALSNGCSVSGLTQAFPIAQQKILRLDGIRSILLVPITMDEQFWGFVGFDDCSSDRMWSKQEESILQAMAASISGALKRQQAEVTIRYQAFHDLLTGLPNRMLFNDRLPLALANAHRTSTMLAVMFLDLDRFKTINDTLGHAVGDQLLQAVARRLEGCLREGDTVSRWGGDEFTLLLPQIHSAEDAAKVAQRTIEVLKPAFHLNGHALYISCSIGIALYPDDGDNAQTLLKNADAALYRVKEQGRNGFQIYTPAINSKASELLAIESSLHQALERQEFVLHYQPQMNLATGQITRMEALLRWHHPQFGLISPQVFIPLAEENGLIGAIGEWVLHTACRQNKRWQSAGLPKVRIAVNLSARQFQQAHLVETIAQVLAQTQLEPDWLELEITETAAMKNVAFTTSILQELAAMGVSISMDDFGTGYSSLGYLKQFPLHTIKIDRSFIQELTTNDSDTAIVRAIIALGQGLHLSVVAEGVETVEQLEYLRSLQCEEVQGYLLSRPLPAEAATEFLQRPCSNDLFNQPTPGSSFRDGD